MAAISRASLRLAGSHAGVEIGADGPSQMALEDLAMLRAVHGSTVLYPGDAHQHRRARRGPWPTATGISYLRTTRGAYPVLYAAGETFPVGGSKVLRSGPRRPGDADRRRGHAARCLGAADQLAGDGIRARVIDLYSVKPVDTATLVAAAAATGGRIVVAEDHHPEGGLGSAVADALPAAGRSRPADHPPGRARDARLRHRPPSCSPRAGIDAEHIAAAARRLLADE